MTEATLLPFDLPAVRRKKLTVDFDGGNQSSDAGLLLLRQAEWKLGVCRRLAEVMPDRRDQSRVGHEMFELVAARAFAISCGYKDGNDLNRLRHDPLLKIAVGRCPESGGPLASQSTISRLENAPRKVDAARLAAALIDQFCVGVKRGSRRSSTLTTRSAPRTAVNNSPSGTRTKTSAGFRPCISTMWQAARPWRRS